MSTDARFLFTVLVTMWSVTSLRLAIFCLHSPGTSQHDPSRRGFRLHPSEQPFRADVPSKWKHSQAWFRVSVSVVESEVWTVRQSIHTDSRLSLMENCSMHRIYPTMRALQERLLEGKAGKGLWSRDVVDNHAEGARTVAMHSHFGSCTELTFITTNDCIVVRCCTYKVYTKIWKTCITSMCDLICSRTSLRSFLALLLFLSLLLSLFICWINGYEFL